MKKFQNAMQDHLVAFIDILGFGSQVLAIKKQRDFQRVYAIVQTVQKALDLPSAAKKPSKQKATNANWGTRVLALSDAVVVAINPRCPVAPGFGMSDFLGFSIYNLAQAQYDCLLTHSILLRGGCGVGPFLFEKDVLVSPAQVSAYYIESKETCVPVIAFPKKVYHWILDNSQGPTGVENWQDVYFRPLYCRAYEDAMYFLDYLRVAVEDAAGEDQLSPLRRHKSLIEANLTNPKAKEKYQWLAKYHNQTIESFYTFARSQIIKL